MGAASEAGPEMTPGFTPSSPELTPKRVFRGVTGTYESGYLQSFYSGGLRAEC